MSQKLVAKSTSLGRAFDESRDVGECQTSTAWRKSDPEIWRQSRKRIVGDFWVSCRKFAEQRTLTSVRKSHDADISENLQAQSDMALLCWNAFFGVSRSTVDRRGKSRIASPACSPTCNDDAFAILDEVGQDFFRVDVRQDRTKRNVNRKIQSIPAMLVSA